MELWAVEDWGETHAGNSFRSRISRANLQPSKQERWCTHCVDWPPQVLQWRLGLGSQEENFHWLRCIHLQLFVLTPPDWWDEKPLAACLSLRFLIGWTTKRTFPDFATMLQWHICLLLHRNSKVFDRRRLGFFPPPFGGACRKYCTEMSAHGWGHLHILLTDTLLLLEY